MSPQPSPRTQRTQDAIADAARTILKTKPVKNLSMVSLAETSQIARATVYNHVSEKSDIYALISKSYQKDFKTLISENQELVAGLKALADFVANDAAVQGLAKHDPKSLNQVISHIHTMPDEIAKILMDALLSWNVSADLISADVVVRWITSHAIAPGSQSEREVGAEVLANALKKDAGV